MCGKGGREGGSWGDVEVLENVEKHHEIRNGLGQVEEHHKAVGKERHQELTPAQYCNRMYFRGNVTYREEGVDAAACSHLYTVAGG